MIVAYVVGFIACTMLAILRWADVPVYISTSYVLAAAVFWPVWLLIELVLAIKHTVAFYARAFHE